MQRMGYRIDSRKTEVKWMADDGASMVLTIVGIFTAMIIFLRFLEHREGLK